jgi:hypothetical protein
MKPYLPQSRFQLRDLGRSQHETLGWELIALKRRTAAAARDSTHCCEYSDARSGCVPNDTPARAAPGNGTFCHRPSDSPSRFPAQPDVAF